MAQGIQYNIQFAYLGYTNEDFNGKHSSFAQFQEGFDESIQARKFVFCLEYTCINRITVMTCRSSCLGMFLGKDVLKKCSKFTGEHSCRSAICVFSCKFAAYFQNTFSKEHLWMAAGGHDSRYFGRCFKCFKCFKILNELRNAFS